MVTAALVSCGCAASTTDRAARTSTEQQPFVAAERGRATAYAREFARSCRPPCRVHSVEPIRAGVWRVRLNFPSGYCVVLYLGESRRTGAAMHEGWESADCDSPRRGGP